MNTKEAVEEYQCSGCVGGPYEECFIVTPGEGGCAKHCPGTICIPTGKLFLGMPKGFNRIGNLEQMKLRIFENKEQWVGVCAPSSKAFKEMGIYNNFNIPVWKYLDEHRNTLVRGLAPRINSPFLHVFLGDVREFIHCLEITKEDIEAMD